MVSFEGIHEEATKQATTTPFLLQTHTLEGLSFSVLPRLFGLAFLRLGQESSRIIQIEDVRIVRYLLNPQNNFAHDDHQDDHEVSLFLVNIRPLFI